MTEYKDLKRDWLKLPDTKATYESISDPEAFLLKHHMQDILALHNDDPEGATEAFKAMLRQSPYLLWPLMKDAIDHHARVYVMREGRACGAFKDIPTTNVREHERKLPNGGGHGKCETQLQSAAPKRSAKSATRARARVAAQMLLDWNLIDGKPLRDVPVKTAREWAAANERNGRFVRLLTHRMPDSGKVGDHTTEDEAKKVWALAQKA